MATATAAAASSSSSGGPATSSSGFASLVKFDTPTLLSEARKRQMAAQALSRKGPAKGGKTLPPVEGSPSSSKGLAAVAASGVSQTEDILNRLLPPREWEKEGAQWVQFVSSSPATRVDVISLQEALDKQLLLRQARETGICPVREELYWQCFDELIRQVTINCAERGLLLLRVRDQIRMTLAAYRTLYESAVAFGMRKALQSEQGKADIMLKNSTLEKEVTELRGQVKELQAKCDAIEKREAERRAAEEKKYSEEVANLKKANQQLKAQLDSMLAPQKK